MCHRCGAEFLAKSLGAKTARHCSRACSLACRRDPEECGARQRPRVASVTESGIRLASSDMYQDNAGQWWVPRADGERARCKQLTCHACGSEFVSYPSGKEVRTHCSKQCYYDCKAKGLHENPLRIKKGSENHHWRGGKVKRKGYVWVYAPDHHSIAGRGTTRKYVLEHRLVMEEMLGRPMLPNETVHHKNGVRDDNRPENLELWGYQPPGQRAGEGKHCETCTCVTHSG